jgi:23S rRNA (uracil-5-)-methyltransferase RumA
VKWEKGLPVWYDGRTGIFLFAGNRQGKERKKMNKAEQSVRLAEGQVIRLPVRRMGINGEGIGYFRKKVVFVEGAIPGETVLARVFEEGRGFVRARLLRVLKPSTHRREPPCPVYEECGGCQLQHIDYPFQLRLKRELLKEAFSRYTGLKNLPIAPAVGMDDPWRYRNKAQLPLKRIGGRVKMGMYSVRSHRLIEMGDCAVQHPEVNRTLEEARRVVEELEIPIYDERKHTGSLRHLVARIGLQTGEVQLVLISRTPDLPREESLVKRLRECLPRLASIVLNVNPRRTSAVWGERSRVLWGADAIREVLDERIYALSAPSFFQLNPVQTVKLYDEVRRAASLTGRETVVDAYCGVGTIGLWLAPEAGRVIGMDTVPEAVRDARENARRNGINNAEYHVGRAEEWLPRRVSEGFRPDVVIVDPPRTGLGGELIDALIRVKVPRLIYVSCNPSTLAKDSARLLEGGYRIGRIVPVDMFPQTSHVEAVCTLEWDGEKA